MKVEINKEHYVEKLKEVLLNSFDSIDAAKRMYINSVEQRVAEEMSSYVMSRYGEYYSDSRIELIKENKRLLIECLEEILY